MTSYNAGMYQVKQPDIQLQPFLPHNSPYNPEIAKARKERQKWKTSLYMFVGLASAVLIINTGFLVWAIRTRGTTNGMGILYEASCDTTKKANIGIHLLINILSSALLGASNYCMQCLSAPTRPEVDKAHRKGTWLDIGIPSLRNVISSNFGKRKMLCWWTLALSSFPLHLCYNSVVFMSISAQTYGVFQFGPEAKTAMERGSFDGSQNLTTAGNFEYYLPYLNGQLYSTAFKKGNLEELTPLECINAYSTTFQSARGNVYLIVDEGAMSANEAYGTFPAIERTSTCSAETSTKWVYSQYGGEAGTCFSQEGNRFLPRIRADPSAWAPFLGHPVKKCLSEPTGQKCRLNFSVHLAIIVIVFNAVKTLTLLISIFTLRNDPMLTVGDAIVSFLREPDASTSNMCLVTQQEIHSAGKHWRTRQQPRTFNANRHTWSSTVKRGKRWTVRLALLAGIIVLVGLFFYGYISIQGTKDISSVLGIGLGNVDPRTIVQSGTAESGVAGVFQNVLIANSPQVIISLIYFSYNATITSMLLAYEWSVFSLRPKSLRVSTSLQGQQRSTYFLQLPYRYALPLLAFSTLLHWLASQSIFVVSVELYNMFGEHRVGQDCAHWDPYYKSPNGYTYRAGYCGYDFITLAYSPLGILLALAATVLLTIGMFILGRKRLSPSPVVGSCSAAIAASCYARPYEQAPWEKQLKWGAFVRPGDQHYNGVAHCGLSSHEVDPPIPGGFYA
ncbi:hypothetical protein CC86DRAFT_401213 [Ophiobolus disseminans]|uniref:DUF6536 domain-containing protein n=1 Tax=Ophiobolus disseminans TaxID=1469910 RepID=A0A6A7AGL7_9PLEO|nr:hypothetical protein CC86DRAFT_401213 [Ophiobolus disseminans]